MALIPTSLAALRTTPCSPRATKKASVFFAVHLMTSFLTAYECNILLLCVKGYDILLRSVNLSLAATALLSKA